MHVTSKYIVHRTWGDLWSLPSGTKIAINLGWLVGCRTLDLPHFKSSVERCGITMLEWNQLFVYKTPSKNCFVFACNITKEHVRSTRTMPLLILYEQLVCFSDDGSCCNMSVFFEQIRASWNRSLVDALTFNPQGRRQERFAQGLPFCLFLLIILHLNEKFRNSWGFKWHRRSCEFRHPWRD